MWGDNFSFSLSLFPFPPPSFSPLFFVCGAVGADSVQGCQRGGRGRSLHRATFPHFLLPSVNSVGTNQHQGHPECGCLFDTAVGLTHPSGLLKGKLRHVKYFKSLNKNQSELGSIQSSRQKGNLKCCAEKDFYGQKGAEAKVLPGKKVDWLLQSYFPLGDSRGLTWRLPN